MPPARPTRSNIAAYLPRAVVLVAVAVCHLAAIAAIAGGSASALRRMAPEPILVSLLAPPPAAATSEPAMRPTPEREPPRALTPLPSAPNVREIPPRSAAPVMPKTLPPQPSPPVETPREARSAPDVAQPSNVAEPQPAPTLARAALPPAAAAAASPSAAPAPTLTPARFDAAYLSNPKPVYPLAARRRGEEGTVLLWVEVSAQGAIEELRIEQSSQSDRLDRAAMHAVAGWRFVAARRGDEAVASTISVPIVFRLED